MSILIEPLVKVTFKSDNGNFSVSAKLIEEKYCPICKKWKDYGTNSISYTNTNNVLVCNKCLKKKYKGD